jgi:predicted ATPase/Tfp pilus assembly protein PilF
VTQLKALGGLRLESTGLKSTGPKSTGPKSTPFTQPKPLLLLSYLSLEGTQQRRHLAELFWREGNRMKSLSMTLTRLRQGAGEVVEADDKQTWSTLKSDAKELLESLDKSQWKQASDLYTGAFLEGVVLEDWSSELEEWVYTTREYLAERVQYALLNLAEEATKARAFDNARDLAERAYKLPGLGGTDLTNLKRLYPLLCAGRSLLAPQVRKEVADYGLSLELTTEQARATFKQTASVNTTLPMRGTSFVGRDEELTELATLLHKANVSLLTLLGPAGVGKTRLALQLAHEQQTLEAFKDGIYFVPLDALNDASLIAPSLLSHLGLTQQGKTEPFTQLTEFIAEKTMLLVLDNFEHLSEGSSLLSQLLSKCPNLKLLVTSREKLRLEEEYMFALEGLPYPQKVSEDANLSEAVQLFRERAQQVHSRFDLEQNLPDVIRLCKLVEGLPLGLELAASWVRLLACKEIADDIERGLELLTSASKNIPERHRSLKAAFEYSWHLLTSKEQEVLRKLSVFVGGFRREAASEVAGATIPILAALVDKSLLRVLPNGRYDRHPLLYQFTREKLAEQALEASETRRNHARFFIALATSIEGELWGKRQKEGLERLEQEHDNLRSVLAWALPHEDKNTDDRNIEARNIDDRNTKGLQLASALERFWFLRGYFSEGRRWLDMLLARAVNQKSPTYLKALYTHARLTREQGDYGAAQSFYETCLRLGQELDTKDIIANALSGLGIIAHERGEYVTARDFHAQSLALERAANNDTGIGACLNNLGVVAYYQQDYPTARTFFEESLAIRRKLEDDYGIGASLSNLGLVALGQEDATSARAYFEEGLIVQKALGDKRSLALTYSNMAMLEEGLGDYKKAKLLIIESLKIVVEIGYKRAATLLLGGLADIAVMQEEFGQAAVFWGALERLRETTGIPLHPNDRPEYEQKVNLAKAQVGDETFTRAWQEGMGMTLEQVLGLVLAGADSNKSPTPLKTLGPAKT